MKKTARNKHLPKRMPIWRYRRKPQASAPEMMHWDGAAATLVGAAHLRHEPPTPCQDAALVVAGKRPLLLVADGAGSAILSHHGAQMLMAGLRRLLATLADDYGAVLDQPATPDAETLRRLALRPVKHAMGLLQDLASEWRHPVSAFNSTLILAVGGRSRWLWLRVGDGALVIERNGQLEMVGAAGKGEYANQTCFVNDRLQPADVQFGIFSSAGLGGVAAMSDGAAERLVNLHTGQVAGLVGQFMAQARTRKLGVIDLHRFFAHAETWQRTTGDDRALAVLAPAA